MWEVIIHHDKSRFDKKNPSQSDIKDQILTKLDIKYLLASRMASSFVILQLLSILSGTLQQLPPLLQHQAILQHLRWFNWFLI